MKDIYFNREGEPISAQEWTRLFESKAYRQIDYIDRYGFSISTIWLGLDHSFGFGDPMIFETLLEGPNGFSEMFRYSTEAAAVKHFNELRDQYCPEPSPDNRIPKSTRFMSED